MTLGEILAQAQEATISTLIPQVGLGGAFLLIFARFLARIEVILTTKLASMEDASRSLSKAVWMLLTEISTPGSFVREEAKRMIDLEHARDLAKADESRRNGRG